MQVVTANLVSGKRVLLRFDIDVPIDDGKVVDDFRLKAGLDTLKLCLDNAEQVILMGHVGRPNGHDPNFSVAPIYKWLVDQGFDEELNSEKIRLLENLRFDKSEDDLDPEYAKELAALGNFYVNEAFAAYHNASSTTILPTLLPHAAGLRFAKEVNKLREVRENPLKPFVAILGGAKVQDKVPVINFLAKKANAVLVGGKLVHEVKEQNIELDHHVLVGHLNQDGLDISEATIETWKPLIMQAKMIVWNGPMGKVESTKSSKGTEKLAHVILNSDAEVIVGGGDTIGFLEKIGLLRRFEAKGFVSVGGGSMLKLLSDGTLPTIEVLF